MADFRVVLIANSLPEDQLGGLQRYVGELATALVQAGVQVTVLVRRLSRDVPETSIRDGARVIRRGFVARSNPLYVALHPLKGAAATASFLRRAPHDVVVHGHFPVQAAPLIAMRNRPFVYTFHAPAHRELLPEHRGRYPMPGPVGWAAARVLRAVEGGVLRRANRIAVLSDFMRREALALAPNADAKMEVVPGGLDIDRFTPGERTPDRWADESRPLLFTARRLVPRTGVRELVEAIPSIRSRHPGVRLALAGSGALREEIAAAIARLDLDGTVRMLGDVTEDELVSWYRRADLVVMPTQQLEGFGLAAVEAMACGTPVLATPVGALPEVVGGLGPGFLAAGAAPSELASAVSDLLAKPWLLEDAAARARAQVVHAYGWNTVVGRYLEIYESARSAQK